MSDAPAPNAPPPPQPAPQPAPPPPNEAPITQNPSTTPIPVGSQAPEKVEPQKDRSESRRNTIKQAFDRAADNPRAKSGHNQPPEPLKPIERPTSANQAQSGNAPYREGGKFARAPGAQNEAQTGNAAGQNRAIQGKAAQLPEGAAYREPPPRMADHAKAEWAAAPESVRGEVYRMHQEFDGAYRRYREDNEEMNKIRHFHKMATEHGTTLDKALANYVGMEHKLRGDPVGGLDMIVNNLNLRSPDGQKLNLRDIAYHVLSQSPEQLQLMQSKNAQQSAGHQIGALHQEIVGLKNDLQQMQYTQQFTYTRSAVDQFADQHPRFDELGDLIEAELKLGFDLQTAYQRADRLRPASTQAAQTRNTPPAQTRQDRSISGAPDSGPSNGTGRRNDKPVGRRDAIQSAINRVQGQFA